MNTKRYEGHTPGPWTINGTGIDEQTIIGTNTAGVKVAVADCPSDFGAGTTEAEMAEVRDLIDGYVDVVDGDYGQPAPNDAMRAVQLIDEVAK